MSSKTTTATKSRRLNTCHAAYALVDNEGRIRYIGRTVMTLKMRWKAHREQAMKNNSQIPVHKWIREVGPDNVEIIPLFQDLDTARLDAAEMLLISQCRRMGLPLLNVSAGGPGAKGVLQSAATRAKRSAALSGRKRPPRDPEWCRKISEAKKGKPVHTPESRKLISERTKAGMAAAKARREAAARAEGVTDALAVLSAAAQVVDNTCTAADAEFYGSLAARFLSA